ncbi:MAG TPA: helix-turn-helix transcriptional regulator [Solirubrobacteraceae bacterium]|nr:helix-turn-helix transcriptional regulator [Solirubrobacteraceae bacterium]
MVASGGPVRDRFAANLRKARNRKGLSQQKLAEVCGLHRTEISLLERGIRSPRLETLITLTFALDLPTPAELLEGLGRL